MEIFTQEFIITLATNLAVIIAALAGGIKAFNKKWKELRDQDNTGNLKETLPRQAQTDLRIIKKLEEVKELLNADRVQVYDFHNGTHYANGRSAVKITCTYESCRYGIKSYQNTLSAIPISCLPNFISTLLKDGEFACSDLEQIKEWCPATYSFKKNMEITAFHDVVFRNAEGEIVGFIAIQFCNNEYNIDHEVIQKAVWYIETELTNLMKGK